jgi:hypothetical protein
VDKQVCHPKNFDFYMCAHAGMIVSNLCFQLCFLLPRTNTVVVWDCLKVPMRLRGSNRFVYVVCAREPQGQHIIMFCMTRSASLLMRFRNLCIPFLTCM